MTLYQELAAEVRRAIDGGVYRAGDKLPSIRDISRGKKLSINTVLKAYGVLEQEGLVLASAKSGYFVRRRPDQSPDAVSLGEPWSGSFEDLMPTLLEKTQCDDLLNLGLAQPEADLIPHELIAQTMRGVLRDRGPEVFGYCDPAGIPELRTQIARMMVAVGVATDADSIIVTNGCQEAIAVAFQIVTNPGDIVVVESPCYCGALQVLNSLGLKILEVPSSPDGGIRLDLVREAAEKYPIAGCYVVTGVSNPNGASMSRDARKNLCELAEHYGFPVIEDFTNGDLADDSPDRRPMKEFDVADNVILCSSFSKSLTPGLRTGWIVAGRHQAEALKLKYGSSLNVSALNQLTASGLVAGGNYRRHLARTRPIHAQVRRVLRDSVERWFPSGCSVSKPKGGFCLWVELPEGYDTTEIARECMQQHVVFAPGEIFSAEKRFGNFLRIGWGGRWDSRIADGVRTIASVIEKGR